MNINEPGSRAEAYGNDDDDAGAHKNPVPQIFFGKQSNSGLTDSDESVLTSQSKALLPQTHVFPAEITPVRSTQASKNKASQQ